MLISIAPMMDYTDRHYRYLARLISKNVLLYTEMVHVGAILYGQRERFLKFDPSEHPVAIQLGGHHPHELAQAAKICEEFGYDEINLNVGCPSDRVQAGKFGACLMAEPDLVAEGIAAMRAAVKIPVTVKTRLGIDEQDSYDFLCQFIDKIAQTGCQNFTIHARKAWLKGLSPKENRTIPPLHYDRVYQLKQDFPYLHIGINGGITNITEIKQHLDHVDSVMIGREAYHNLYFLNEIEQEIFDNPSILSRADICLAYANYMEQQHQQGIFLKHMVKHLFGLFHGQPHSSWIRRELAKILSDSRMDFTTALTLLQNIMRPI